VVRTEWKGGGADPRSRGGTRIEAPPAYSLCRCGGSQNKPFCDGTHKSNNFNGREFARKNTASDRAESFVGEGFTIHDDHSRCAHAGVCTDKLSEVFKLGVEPRVDPDGAQADEIARVVSLGRSELLTAGLS